MIAVVHSIFSETWGGVEKTSLVLANSLAETRKVEYYTEHKYDKDSLEENLGFRLEDNIEFNQVEKPKLSRILAKTDRFHLLKKAIHAKYFQELAKSIQGDYELIIFTSKLYETDIDLSLPTAQYIHSSNGGVSEIRERNILYRKICRKFAELERMKGLETNLVNSRYTKQKVEKNNPQLQDNTEVVYPPVNSDITPKPWSKKQDQAIILGRIEPGKRIEEAIEIVEQSRLNLKIVGKSQDTQYIRRLKSRYTNNVEIREDLPWQDVRAEIRNSKIGLNTTGKTENFGISVVEYMKGNCLPLVRGGSGPEEIVPGQKHVYETRTEGGKTGKLGF